MPDNQKLSRDDLIRNARQPLPRVAPQARTAQLPPNAMPNGPIVHPTKLFEPVQEPFEVEFVEDDQIERTDGAQSDGAQSADSRVGDLSVPLAQLDSDTLYDQAMRLARDGDKGRVAAACELLNTWNYAVQVQANRPHWEPADFRGFMIAFAAMDRIGQDAVATAQVAQRRAEIERQLERNRNHE